MERQVRGLLYRLHCEISGRLDDDSPLTTDPGNHGWPVFIIMALTRLALCAVPTCAASQRLLPTLLGLSLLASGVVELICLHSPVQLTLYFMSRSLYHTLSRVDSGGSVVSLRDVAGLSACTDVRLAAAFSCVWIPL